LDDILKKADENDSVFRREINGDGDGKIGIRKLLSKFDKKFGNGNAFLA
jgi:hypothetical protein